MTLIRTSLAILTVLCVVLAGCSTPPRSKGGGYYKDDGPGTNIPSQIDSIPDAIPRIESHARSTLKPYVVFGKRYVPISDERPFRQEGTASWYGKKFHGNKTANGEKYDMYAMTAAHPTLPLPSYARVTHAKTKKSVIVRINDRGPFHSKRVIDLSYAAAAKLGLIAPGSGQVIIEAITNADIARGATQTTKAAMPETPPAPAAVVVAKTQPVPDALAAIQAQPTSSTTSAQTADQSGAIKSTAVSLDADAPGPAPASMASSTLAQPAIMGAGQIYLQFGAFSGNENARHLAQKLNQKIAQVESRNAFVQTESQLHKVQIGPYPTRTAAVNASLRIQQETGIQPSITLR